MLTWEDIIDAEAISSRYEYGRMCSGITVLRQGRALIAMLPHEGFRTLSSGYTNGGYMDSALAVVNITSMGGKAEMTCMAQGLDTYDQVNHRYAEKLGLDPARTVFQGTAANMDNAAIVNGISDDGINVSFAVTAGIRHNGGRAGDPAYFDEASYVYSETPGTIITIMAVDADLSDGAMFQAMLLATEAKSCVIQELQAKSLYSKGIATGSGTDQVVVISNKNSSVKLDSVQKGSELADAIAKNMASALREAFDRQSGMNTETQWDPLMIMSRYGLTVETVREEIRFPARMDELLSALEALRRNGYCTAVLTALMRIGDDISVGLLEEEAGMGLAKDICEQMVLEDTSDPVVRLRLKDIDNVPDLISYVSALKLMETVKARREAHGNRGHRDRPQQAEHRAPQRHPRCAVHEVRHAARHLQDNSRQR